MYSASVRDEVPSRVLHRAGPCVISVLRTPTLDVSIDKVISTRTYGCLVFNHLLFCPLRPVHGVRFAYVY